MARLLRKKNIVKKKKKLGDEESVDKSRLSTETRQSIDLPNDTGKKPIQSQKRPSAVSKSTTISKEKEKNFIEKGLEFLREVKAELKKVVWPSRKQTMGSTIVVIILVMIMGSFLGVVDMILSWLISNVL